MEEVLFHYIKSYTQCTEVVDGSNESLYHANEEFDPNLCTGVPLQKSFEKVDVLTAMIDISIKHSTHGD